MNIKKYLARVLAVAVMAAALGLPGVAMAEEASSDTAAEAQTDGSVQPPVKQEPVTFTYKHTSQRYGYSIFCPTKPKVVPASAYNESDKGDVLIYSGSYDNIQKGWIVCINGYQAKEIPDNIGSMDEAAAKEFLKNFAQTYGLQYAQIVEIPNKNDDGTNAEGCRYAVAGPTADAVEVDSDGDGVMDSYAVAETKMMKVFLPGQYGGHFVLGLLENGELDSRDVQEFMTAAVYTLQQWPTSAYDAAKSEAEKNPKKK